MDRFRGRRGRRAVTLIELLLASIFFSLLILVMFLATQSSTAAQRKAFLTQDAQQAVHIVLEQLKEELRGTRVSVPLVGAESDTLAYERVELEQARVRLDSLGNPSWLGPYQISLNDQGVLLTTRGKRSLGRLGPQGSVRFEHPEEKRLILQIDAQRGSNETGRPSASSETTYELYLPNN